jgi:DNA mismatch repair protein MutS2
MSQNLLGQSGLINLSLLDWDLIINEISIVSHFEITKKELSSPVQPKSKRHIEFEYNSLQYFIENFEYFSSIIPQKLEHIASDTHFFELIPLLAKGKIATISELNFLCNILEFHFNIMPDLKDWNKCENFLLDHSEKNKINKNFIKPFRSFVDKKGKTSFERHPLLVSLFNDLRNLERDLRQSISKIAKDELFSSSLQFTDYDVVNDRYVLAVRSDSYNSDQGPIIGKSSSGMTLFVEPYSLRDKSTKRIHTLAKIEQIIDGLAREYSEFLHQISDSIDLIKTFILDIDLTFTKMMYCERHQLIRPKLLDKFSIQLNGLYHPLLDKPVSNNIEIPKDKDGFILSGPNTGGKTVTLKSLTIAHLFMHLGLFVPATQAEIYPVKNIYYFSNDQQDLSEGLSSFASEAKNYLKLIENLGEESLVVVDEIFNSTSSEEASALAISFLEEVHSLSTAKIIISTHHQLFKTFIHSNENYISAHVGYDLKTNKPTYKVYVGEPGSSMAFTIFESLSDKYNIHTAIPDRAKTILDKKHVSYEKLLQDLSSKKSELDKYVVENRKLNQDIKNQKKSMEGILHLEKEKLVNQFEKRLSKVLKDAEYLFRETKRGNVESQRQLSRKVDDINSGFNKIKSETKGNEEKNLNHLKKASIKEISIGDSVYSKLLNKEVKVIGINERKKEVQINNKNMNIWAPIQSILTQKASILGLPKAQEKVEEQVKISVQRQVTGKIEIDCRGMRLEDFQRTAENSMDELICGDIPFLTIIHGHGSGILKTWLRNYIRSNKDLEWEALDGNDGCTKITLKT